MGKIPFLVIVSLLFSTTYCTAATIDRMTIHTFGGYSQTYDPNSSSSFEKNFMIFGMANKYYLNDGSSWDSGAGSHSEPRVGFVGAQLNGSMVEYTFDPPEFYVFFQNTDYNAGDHSAQGVLRIDNDPIITVENNTKLARMQGYAEIISNDPTYYSTFNYYSANVGDRVFYSMEYWIYDTYWTPNTFDSRFEYNLNGYVDFTEVIPEPSTILIFVTGIFGLLSAKRKY